MDEIIRIIEEHWVAVTSGYACTCGHVHHGRQLYRDGRMDAHHLTQYGFCDEVTCSCLVLQRVL